MTMKFKCKRGERGPGSYRISWTGDDGWRYHTWKGCGASHIMKNSPADADRWARTRFLKPMAKRWAPVMAEIEEQWPALKATADNARGER